MGNADGEYVVVMCQAGVGNTYPVSRATDYDMPEHLGRNPVSHFHYLHPIPFNTETRRFERQDAPRDDKALKAGFDSHFASVSVRGHYEATDATDDYDFDELVVKEE